MNPNTPRTQNNTIFSYTNGGRKKSGALLSIILTLTLLLIGLPLAQAEQMAEYRDNIFSFQYPASWKRGAAKDGSLILEVTGSTDSAVLAFGITTDLLALTGDKVTDEPTIQKMISEQQNSSINLKLNGKYEMLQYGTLHGFRSFGTWAENTAAQQIYLSDGMHLLVFRFIGISAMAAQDSILSSIVVNNMEKPIAKDGYVLLERKNYSLLYPEGYSMLEQDTGIAFIDKTKGNMMMVRARTLDTSYTEALAPSLAVTYLPKSSRVAPEPEMVLVGPWKAALISGDTESGPLAFYALGKGKTALLLLFLGQDALTHVEAVLSSLTIE